MTETPEPNRKSVSAPSRRVPAALLAVGVTSAGLVAVLTHQKAPVAEGGNAPNAPAADAASQAARREGSPAPRRVEDASAPRAPVLAVMEGELDDLVVPTVEEARAYQKPQAKPRADIVELGLDALLDEPKCEPPAALVKTARSGEGIYGCVIDVPGGRPFVVGHAALRKSNGNFEVGGYEEGRRSGQWEQYYPTGILAARGGYSDDQRDGVWDEFDAEGKHRVSRSYRTGAKHGVVLNFNGNKPRVSLYYEGIELDRETRKPVATARVADARAEGDQ